VSPERAPIPALMAVGGVHQQRVPLVGVQLDHQRPQRQVRRARQPLQQPRPLAGQ